MRKVLIAPMLFVIFGMFAACMAQAEEATVQQGIVTSWGPDARAYYGLANDGSSSTKLAIVIPGAQPNLATRLSTYRTNKSLPTCTTGNGCLTFLAQDNGSLPSSTIGSWPTRGDFVTQLLSAGCKNCKLVVVESNSASNADVKTAAIKAKSNADFVLVLPLMADGATEAADIGTSFHNSGKGLFAPVGDGTGSVHGVHPDFIGVARTALTADGSGRGVSEAVNGGTGGFGATWSRPAYEPNIGSSFHSVTTLAVVGSGAYVIDDSGNVTTADGTDIAAAFGMGMIGAIGGALVTPADISTATMYTLSGTDDNSNSASGSFNKAGGFGSPNLTGF